MMRLIPQKKVLGLLLLFLSIVSVTPCSAQSGELVYPVPPPQRSLPSLTADPSKVIERLKLYVTTGEGLAKKFEISLKGYKSLAKEYIKVQSGCINEPIYSSPLFKDADEYSICNQNNQREIKTRLQLQAMQLDRFENELKDIKNKVGQAGRRVTEMLQLQGLQDAIDKMDSSIDTVEEINRELNAIENQK